MEVYLHENKETISIDVLKIFNENNALKMIKTLSPYIKRQRTHEKNDQLAIDKCKEILRTTFCATDSVELNSRENGDQEHIKNNKAAWILNNLYGYSDTQIKSLREEFPH